MKFGGEGRVIVFIAFLSAAPVEACEQACEPVFATDTYSDGLMLDIIRVDPEWVPAGDPQGVPEAPLSYEAAGFGSPHGGVPVPFGAGSIIRAGDWTP
jgi:hypothetical protein